MKTVLLTGATGFLGSYLLESLLQRGYRVVILTRSGSDTRRIEHLLDKVDRYSAEIESIGSAFSDREIDIVIHTACHYGRKGEAVTVVLETNLVFSLHLLQAAIEHKVSTFINTDTILPGGLNAYTTSKKQFVDWLSLLGEKIQVVNIRPDQVYGVGDSGDKFVPSIIGQLKSHAERISLTPGGQIRDFIYVSDVVSAYLMIIEKAPALEAFTQFDVGSGDPTTIREFVEALFDAYQRHSGASDTVLDFGALSYRPREVMKVTVDTGGLEGLGWLPAISQSAGFDRIMGSKL